MTPDKAEEVIRLQHIRPLMDALGCCRLQWVELALDLNYYAPVLESITGVYRSWEDLLTDLRARLEPDPSLLVPRGGRLWPGVGLPAQALLYGAGRRRRDRR